MDSRGIIWACSLCGARFSTKADLQAHLAGHQGDGPETTQGENILTASAPAAEWAAPKTEETRKGQDPQPGPDATEVPAGEGSASATELPPRRVSSTTPRRVLRWVAAAALCAIVGVLVVAFPHQIAHEVALAVTTRPQAFTQLYFSNPTTLPKSLALSGPNPFRFTVANHEGHEIIYSYTVTMASSDDHSILAQGRIDLQNNVAATRLVNVRPTRPATQYLISVSLLGRNEAIWFRGVSR